MIDFRKAKMRRMKISWMIWVMILFLYLDRPCIAGKIVSPFKQPIQMLRPRFSLPPARWSRAFNNFSAWLVSPQGRFLSEAVPDLDRFRNLNFDEDENLRITRPLVDQLPIAFEDHLEKIFTLSPEEQNVLAARLIASIPVAAKIVEQEWSRPMAQVQANLELVSTDDLRVLADDLEKLSFYGKTIQESHQLIIKIIFERARKKAESAIEETSRRIWIPKTSNP